MGTERYEFDAQINMQDLAGYYMQPFQECARDSKAASFMCAYNSLNGVPTCADPYILQDVLRDHWNWTDAGNYVVSDCDAIQNAYLPHGYKDTREETVAAALSAGTDLDCGLYYTIHLPGAFEQGLVNGTVIDLALERLYSALVRLGYFDPASNSPYRALDWSDVSTPEAQALALQAAEKSIVLLKNDGTLPLSIPKDNSTLTLAFIGNWGNATTDMQATYAGPAPYLRSPYMAALNTSGVKAIYTGSPGDPTTNGYIRAIDAAKEADVILFLDGPTPDSESESNDRNLIRWSGERVDVMTYLAGMGKPFVLVQMGGQRDDAPFLNHENVSAIIWGGYPGQSGGDAIMNVLTGKVAPAGRLPVTQYPADYVNQVPMTDMALRPNKTSGYPGRTYMWYENATIPFGYGLHYTNFSVSIDSPSNETISTAELGTECAEHYKDLCPFRNISVSVQNTGATASDYVALGFLAGAHGPEPYPLKQLVAYTRLADVGAGETKKATLQLTLGSLGRHNERGDLVVYPGEYRLLVDVPTKTEWRFRVSGEEMVLDEWPQPK
jgi:beta-D-xylosidase 4